MINIFLHPHIKNLYIYLTQIINMKWYNSRTDKLPKDKQEVLISVEGENYIAIYDANRKLFRIEGELKETTFKSDLKNLYWTIYLRPGL